MRAKQSFVIVVDSSVAMAFGGPKGTYPVSKNCRDFCFTMLHVCHRVILTPDIKEEWKRHASSFASKWLSAMVARGKFSYLDEGAVHNPQLRQDIRAFAVSEHDWEAMDKDCRLLEASLATDKRIASLDEDARKRFARVSQSVGVIKAIVWVNPSHDPAAKIEWLESGAPDRRELRLG